MRPWVVAAAATTLLSVLVLAGLRDYPPLLAGLTGTSLGLLVLVAGLSFRRLRRELTTPTFIVEEGLPRGDEATEAPSSAPGKENQRRDQ